MATAIAAKSAECFLCVWYQGSRQNHNCTLKQTIDKYLIHGKKEDKILFSTISYIVWTIILIKIIRRVK